MAFLLRMAVSFFAGYGLAALFTGCTPDAGNTPNWPAIVPPVLAVQTVQESGVTSVAFDEPAAAPESAADIPGRPEHTAPAPISPSAAARVSVGPAIIHHMGRWWRKVNGRWLIHHEGQWMTWHSYKLQFGTAVEQSAESFQGGCAGGQCGPAAARRFRGRR